MANGKPVTRKAVGSKRPDRRKPAPRSAERVRKHRKKMRRAGMKLLQIWVPDPAQKGFAEECRRQSLLLRNDPHEKEVLEEIAAVADLRGWK